MINYIKYINKLFSEYKVQKNSIYLKQKPFETM